MELQGRVAVVTGGGRGLGRVFAEALAKAGASVAPIARTETAVMQTAAGITAQGGKALAFVADVTDARAIERAIGEIEKQLGPVDLLVNNAGVPGPFGPFVEANLDDWWHCMDVNLRGQLICAKAVLPGMIARKRGRIINVASGAGTMAIPYFSAYVTSKAALMRFSEILAMETRDHGVAVFAIEPGTVRTTMAEQALESPEGKKWLPWFPKIFAEGRDVSPDRGAELVLWLASGRADALSGRFINIADNVEEMIARAGQIQHDDLYCLRLAKLGARD